MSKFKSKPAPHEEVADRICSLVDMLDILDIKSATDEDFGQDWYIDYRKCLEFVDKYYKAENSLYG